MKRHTSISIARTLAKLGTRSYWLLFSTLLGLAVLGGSLAERFDGSRPGLVTTPLKQAGPLAIQELSALLSPAGSAPAASPELPASQVHGPVRIEAGPAGELFVIDDGDGEVIKELDQNGELVQVLAGAGAPSMRSVTDLAILPKRLWVADLLGGAIHRLDRDTGAWQTSRAHPEPYRLESLGLDQDRLAVMRVVAPRLFDITTADGAVLGSFGRLLKNQEDHALALDGFITRSGQSIFFSGKHLGLLASFSAHGDLNFLAHPISSPKEPVVMQRGASRWLRHGPIPASKSVAAAHDVLCVLSPRPHELRVRSFVDLYRVEDGSYLKSLLLPPESRWDSLALGGDYLFVASAREIVRWPRAVLGAGTHQGRTSTGRSIIRFTGHRPEKERAS